MKKSNLKVDRIVYDMVAFVIIVIILLAIFVGLKSEITQSNHKLDNIIGTLDSWEIVK